MPKILIREQDFSRNSLYGEDNFSILVPGYAKNDIYCSTREKEAQLSEELLNLQIGPNVYKFTKVSDFENLIGCQEDKTEPSVTSVEPTYTQIELANDVEEGEELTVDNYLQNISIEKYLVSLHEDSDHKYYIMSKADDQNSIGKDYCLVGAAKEVYHLIPIDTWFADMSERFEFAEDETLVSKEKVVKVLNENLGINGRDASEGSIAKHIGNQIAFELLNLGYTVLFKVMDPSLGVSQLDGSAFWEPLADRSVYTFRYLISGLKGEYASSTTMNQMCKIASSAGYDIGDLGEVENAEMVDETRGRGDCIALCDINESLLSLARTDKEIAKGIAESANAISNADKYAAIFGPQVIYSSVNKASNYTYKNHVFPASFHYLACAAHAQKTYKEWYAVAGYTRGVSSLPIKGTTFTLGERVINTLAPRVPGEIGDTKVEKAVNLILKERGSYYIWGNRTAELLDIKGLKFSHFLNIRQLCCTLKQHLYTACRKFVFDPNSDLLWINFVNAMKPLLETMRADQGITGYKITKIINSKKALLTANIKIVPVEAVEDFDIKIELNDSLSGIEPTVEESAR